MTINELQQFHAFIAEKLTNGGVPLSPEEALDEWREQNPDPFDTEDDLAAIQAALDAVANGDRGVPFDEFDREFRKKHNIPDVP
jgi:hypothetical protein